jgi:hypothetical protein
MVCCTISNMPKTENKQFRKEVEQNSLHCTIRESNAGLVDGSNEFYH